MKYNTFIFDMDGTILDTLEDLADTMNYCLLSHNMPKRTLPEIKSFVGNGIYKIIERSVPKDIEKSVIDEMFIEFNNYYKDHCSIKTKPYDGIIDIMQKLTESGFNVAVVSNKADYAVKSLCDDYFGKLVKYSVGAKEGQRKKPYPDSVFDALNYFNCDVKDAVYIGDSEVDIETAKNAGIDLILVSWGFRDEGYLKSLGATYIIHSPSELLM